MIVEPHRPSLTWSTLTGGRQTFILGGWPLIDHMVGDYCVFSLAGGRMLQQGCCCVLWWFDSCRLDINLPIIRPSSCTAAIQYTTRYYEIINKLPTPLQLGIHIIFFTIDIKSALYSVFVCNFLIDLYYYNPLKKYQFCYFLFHTFPAN